MLKYSFVMHHNDYEGFLKSLRDLGIVDITVSGWVPTDDQLALIHTIDKCKEAISNLSSRLWSGDRADIQPFHCVEDALTEYIISSERLTKLEAEITKTEKEIEDLKVWGEFDKRRIERLRERGIEFIYYSTFIKEFIAALPVWRESYIVEEISRCGDSVYFVVVTTPDSPPVTIDAMEIKAPEVSYTEKEKSLAAMLSEKEILDLILDRCAGSLDELREYRSQLSEKLHFSQIKTTLSTAAEGSLIVAEGWAPEETEGELSKFLETAPVVAIKDKPVQGDNPPVLLRNNKFAGLFEVIGKLYSLPRYGTIDLTPFFAPFYMLFFGFCLADAAYGALFVIAALIARNKVREDLRPIAKLVMYMGLSAIFFGLLTGNVGGIELAHLAAFHRYKDYFFDPGKLFFLAIGIGIVQILYAMVIKIFLITKTRGFRYTFSTIGWMIVIVSGLAMFLLPKFGIKGYSADSASFMTVTGAGLFCMFFLNSPGKSPFYNFGIGLWYAYNQITELLSDTLSYIRLFALALAGGILALVFNRLAVGMSPDIIIVKQIVMLTILSAGQAITLFMGTLSAFVHPLRLTFVEFYRNAGFEPGSREFRPLKRDEL